MIIQHLFNNETTEGDIFSISPIHDTVRRRDINSTFRATTEATKTIMSQEVLSYFLLVNFWGPGQCVTILGLIGNVVNAITFVKQGLRDSVNVSLLGLTISDLGSLLFLFFLNLCFTPPIVKMDLPFYPQQIMYFLFWGHVIFTRVTTGTTAWIAFERCLCIVTPLKMKSIVKPRRTIAFIVVLYVIMIAAVAPMFYTSRFTWIFDSTRNKSIVGYTKIANGGHIDDIVYVINNVLPLTFFTFIVVCTFILFKTLRRNAKWRQQTAMLTKAHVISKRDTKVAKLVLIISIVFICCYAPGAVFFIWPLTDSSMTIAGSEKNFVIAVFSLLLHLEGINASANLFIYIKMSSKFKRTLRQVFCVRCTGHIVKDVDKRYVNTTSIE